MTLEASMLSLKRWFGDSKRMRSVSVYLRENTYHVDTLHGSDGGDPCIAAGPVTSLAADQPPEALGAAIRQGLKLSTHKHPFPKNQDDWKRVLQPLLDATKTRSWAAMAKRSSSVRIDQRGDSLQLSPSRRTPKGSFEAVAERERTLLSPNDADLGRIVMDELAFALARDGA
jgi:hypothetical protein